MKRVPFLDFFKIIISSKQILIFILICWIMNIIYSILCLSAGNDDAAYFLSSLGLLHKHQLMLHVADGFEPKFNNFPGYQFFQGIFLILTSPLKVPINLYTYRIFQGLTVVLLITVSLISFYILHSDDRKRFLASSNIFMISLAMTPFAQFFIAVRPEVLGMTLVTLAAVFFGLWEIYTKRLFLCLSGFTAGCSIIMHPNFILFAASITVIVLIFTIKRVNISSAILYLVFFILPTAFLGWWIWIYYPDSFRELAFNFQRKSGTIANIGYSIIILFKNSFMLNSYLKTTAVKIYYSVFWLPFLIFLIVSLIYILKEGNRLMKRGNIYLLHITFFLVALIQLLSNSQGTFSYYLITSYFIVYVFSLLSSYKINTECLPVKLHPGAFMTSIIAILIIVFLNPAFHSAKSIFSDSHYYNMSDTYIAVNSQLKSGDTLFIGTGNLMMPFLSFVDSYYRGNTGMPVYFIFPDFFLESKVKQMQFFLKSKINAIEHNKSIWGFPKKNIKTFHRDTGRVRAIVPFRIGGNLPLNFTLQDIIHEDNRNLFFRPLHINY